MESKKKKSKVFQEKDKMIHRRLQSRRRGWCFYLLLTELLARAPGPMGRARRTSPRGLPGRAQRAALAWLPQGWGKSPTLQNLLFEQPAGAARQSLHAHLAATTAANRLARPGLPGAQRGTRGWARKKVCALRWLWCDGWWQTPLKPSAEGLLAPSWGTSL